MSNMPLMGIFIFILNQIKFIKIKFQANARELLFVGYAVDGDETAVDEIWVRMKNETTR